MKHDDFVIPIGYNKSKCFKEVGLKEIDGLVAWLEKNDLQDQFKNLYDAATEYLELNKYDPGFE